MDRSVFVADVRSLGRSPGPTVRWRAVVEQRVQQAQVEVHQQVVVALVVDFPAPPSPREVGGGTVNARVSSRRGRARQARQGTSSARTAGWRPRPLVQEVADSTPAVPAGDPRQAWNSVWVYARCRSAVRRRWQDIVESLAMGREVGLGRLRVSRRLRSRPSHTRSRAGMHSAPRSDTMAAEERGVTSATCGLRIRRGTQLGGYRTMASN